ncbi:Lactate utilization protein A [Poriferisphaera corsica]|uniref:Lactate utilization protein A n=1 Tax=Poriferisphaera corsica TaxID=2528020 RepID=A0A517YQK4_9BACT|nr:(Fe-S)-binding protein [Poriferisphaera corsica]QDU32481.1 Lactate utilization protein A [Poriferisphaera corsica]
MKVALFITCLTDNFYPRTGIALVKILEHLGCEVVFPEEQTCCGQPMWNNGFAEETRGLAKRMIDVFEGYEYVVTPSGSCAAMVRDYYEEAFEGMPEWQAKARNLAERTYEFIEFLVKVAKIDLREFGAKWDGDVTYHYSCHLRGIGMTDEAVQLLKQIEGVRYHELEKMEQCCGFGGTFAMKFSEVSGEMSRDKVGCIEKTGAKVVVVNDAGCSMNIEGTCRREGVDVKFMSLAEIIAESLSLMDDSDQVGANG